MHVSENGTCTLICVPFYSEIQPVPAWIGWPSIRPDFVRLGVVQSYLHGFCYCLQCVGADDFLGSYSMLVRYRPEVRSLRLVTVWKLITVWRV